MDIGALMIGLAILIIGTIYTVSPLGYKNKKTVGREPANEKNSYSLDLKGMEKIALTQLRDLDFDYQTGKVSDEDYQPLRTQLLTNAAQIIDVEKQEEAQLEERLRTRRQEKSQMGKCPHCGSDMKPDDGYCPRCGQPTMIRCQNCGKMIHSTDQYCSACGTSVMKLVEPPLLQNEPGS